MAVKKAVAKIATKKEFSLPDEKVTVKYVLRQHGNITNRNHVAYGGKLEGATDLFPAKMAPTGYFEDILTEEEAILLENKLALAPGELNPNNMDGYFNKVSVMLGKTPVTLHLYKPLDYLKYKILLSYTDVVSPDIFSTQFKKTYKYEIVREKDVMTKATKKLNYNKEAYKLLGKIEDSKEQLVGAYRSITGRKVSNESSHDWLVTQVGNLIDQDARKFVEILTDEHYETKLFIEQAIDHRAIKRVKGLYYTADGMELSDTGESPTLINAIAYLDNIENQDVKLVIKSNMK
jgi:hypothetical protein